MGVFPMAIVQSEAPVAMQRTSSTENSFPPLNQYKDSCKSPIAKWQVGCWLCLSQHKGHRSMCQSSLSF